MSGPAPAPPGAAPVVLGTETAAELTATLKTYEEQLQQVNDLLGPGPEYDANVLAIKQDVAEALRITREKLRLRRLADDSALEASFVEGAVVEARFEDGAWGTVRVLAVEGEGEARAWKVVSIGYATTFTVPRARLRAWAPPLSLKKGDYVEAVNPATGLFYPAAVDTVTDTGTVWVYVVSPPPFLLFAHTHSHTHTHTHRMFRGAKAMEEVPLTSIKAKGGGGGGGGGGGVKRKKDASEMTEAEKERERKREKRERWQERVKGMEQEQEAGRKSWKDHQNKQKRKPPVAGRVGQGLAGARK